MESTGSGPSVTMDVNGTLLRVYKLDRKSVWSHMGRPTCLCGRTRIRKLVRPRVLPVRTSSTPSAHKSPLSINYW